MNQEPKPQATLTGKLVALAGCMGALAYLSNLGFGVGAEIPDLLPGIGNVDEVIATTILLTCLSRLGIRLVPNFDRPKEDVPPNLEHREKLPPAVK